MKKIRKIFVTIVTILCITTVAFAETKATSEEPKVNQRDYYMEDLLFQVTYNEALQHVIEYRKITPYKENKVYLLFKEKGKGEVEIEYYREYEFDQLFEFLYESEKEFDFILIGRVCEDGTPEEQEQLFELAPTFTVADELVPPNPKKLRILRNLIYKIEKNKIPIGWIVKPLPELDKDCYLVEVAIGSVSENKTIAKK